MNAKIQHKPKYNGCHKDRGSGLGQIILYLIPYIDCHGSGIRSLVLRKLDQKRILILILLMLMKDKGDRDRNDETDHIQGIRR